MPGLRSSRTTQIYDLGMAGVDLSFINSEWIAGAERGPRVMAVRDLLRVGLQVAR